MLCIQNCGFKEASRGKTVVEHLPHHPEVGGSSPGSAIGTGEEKMLFWVGFFRLFQGY
jgi:hypothetical protein